MKKQILISISLLFLILPITSFSSGVTQVSYSSNRNYFINSNGLNIVNPTITITLTGPLVDTDSQFGNNSWSIQLNTYQPLGTKTALSQYVIAYQGGLLFGEEHFVASNDAILFNAVANGLSIPVNDFISGAIFQIKLNTNSTGNVISVMYSFTSSLGVILYQSTTLINGSPIVGWELNILGVGNGSTANFSSISGIFSYSSITTLSSTGIFPGNETFVQYKNLGTIEKSNVQYSLPTQQDTNNINQNFGLTQIITTSSTSSTETITTISIGVFNSTLIPQKITYTPTPSSGKPVIDKGIFTSLTTLTGFTFNVTNSQSFSLGLPSGCFPSSILFNKTINSLQCLNFSYFFKSFQYQTNVIINGVGIGSQVCLPITSNGAQVNFNATTNPTQIFVGNNILDFSDIPQSMSPTFNLQLNQLCYTPPIGNYNIDPLAIDGTGSCQDGNNNFCNLTLTITHSPDVIEVLQTCASGSGCGAFSLPTATGLTFTQRTCIISNGMSCTGGNNGNNAAEEDYAIASSTFSGKTITCTESENTNAKISCNAFGISGANTGSPFDGCSSGNAVTGSGNSNTASVSCTTSNSNDIILGLNSAASATTATPGGAFTVVQTNYCSTSPATDGQACSINDIVSSTQSALSISLSLSASVTWAEIGDAIKATAGTVTQKITITAIGPSSPTIGISGCSPSNSTFTGNNRTKTYTLSAICSVSLSNPSPSTNTRWCWNISPHTTCSTGTITFSTCGSGTCSTYVNTTYYQQSENFTATPQTPNTWDGIYTWSLSGTYLGTTYSDVHDCTLTTNGGGIVHCQQGSNLQFIDYNKQVCTSSPIGNTWVEQGTNCFTDNTPNNVHNVNYIQTTSSPILVPTNNDLSIGIIVILIVICFIGFIAFFRRR